MAQYIPGESFGGRLGTALGTGIGSGLQNLAQQKVEELSQRRLQARRGAFWEQLGLPPSVGSLDPGVQKALLDRLEGIGLPQQPTGLQAIQQQATPQKQQELPQITQGIEQVAQAVSDQSKTGSDGIKIGPNQAERRFRQQQELGERKLKFAEEKTKRQEETNLRKEQRIEQQDIDKETAPYYEEVTKGYKAAKQGNKRLDKINGLLEKGNLGIPIINSFLNTIKEGIFGPHGPKLNLDFLKTADAQELEKLVADFLPEAKDFFPGRITDKDLVAFFARLPELTKSGAGNKRVVRSLKAANDEKILRKELADQIIQENNGRRPRNLDQLVEQRGKEQFDKLYEEFVNAAPIPEVFLGGIARY